MPCPARDRSAATTTACCRRRPGIQRALGKRGLAGIGRRIDAQAGGLQVQRPAAAVLPGADVRAGAGPGLEGGQPNASATMARPATQFRANALRGQRGRRSGIARSSVASTCVRWRCCSGLSVAPSANSRSALSSLLPLPSSWRCNHCRSNWRERAVASAAQASRLTVPATQALSKPARRRASIVAASAHGRPSSRVMSARRRRARCQARCRVFMRPPCAGGCWPSSAPARTAARWPAAAKASARAAVVLQQAMRPGAAPGHVHRRGAAKGRLQGQQQGTRHLWIAQGSVARGIPVAGQRQQDPVADALLPQGRPRHRAGRCGRRQQACRQSSPGHRRAAMPANPPAVRRCGSRRRSRRVRAGYAPAAMRAAPSRPTRAAVHSTSAGRWRTLRRGRAAAEWPRPSGKE